MTRQLIFSVPVCDRSDGSSDCYQVVHDSDGSGIAVYSRRIRLPKTTSERDHLRSDEKHGRDQE